MCVGRKGFIVETHARTHARTHTHTYIRWNTHTHTHTHTQTTTQMSVQRVGHEPIILGRCCFDLSPLPWPVVLISPSQNGRFSVYIFSCRSPTWPHVIECLPVSRWLLEYREAVCQVIICGYVGDLRAIIRGVKIVIQISCHAAWSVNTGESYSWNISACCHDHFTPGHWSVALIFRG